MRKFYEVTCCNSGFHYWQKDTRHEAEKEQDRLLKDGGHTNVTIFETTRRAISIKQPRKEAGTYCVRTIGLPCLRDHDHVEEKK